MNEVRLIEPGFVKNAHIRIQKFYKTHTLSFSVSPEVKKDASLSRDGVLFYLMQEHTILQSINLPWTTLLSYEEVWVDAERDWACLYAVDDLLYSYRIVNPYRP